MPESSQDQRKAVAAALADAKRIVLTTHARPDGDALGSVLGLHLGACNAGKISRMFVLDELPRRYQFLFRDAPCPVVVENAAEAFERAAGQADRVVVLDTSSHAQMKPIAEPLAKLRDKVIVIDHHPVVEDVGALAWRDTAYAAAGVMVEELLTELGWKLTAAMAEPLMTAIVTDTGWMRYSNTDARTLQCLARMLEAGMKTDTLYARLYQSDRPERVKLLSAAMDSLELHAGGQLAMVTITAEDFARTGASQDETEDFASEPLRIAGVELAFTLIEQADTQTRANLRSRALVDVSAIARAYAGGGHARASGFRSRDPISVVRQRLLDAGTAALAAAKVP